MESHKFLLSTKTGEKSKNQTPKQNYSPPTHPTFELPFYQSKLSKPEKRKIKITTQKELENQPSPEPKKNTQTIHRQTQKREER